MTCGHRDRRALALALLLLLGGLGGCASIGDRGQPLIPTKYRTQTGAFVISSGYPLAEDDRLVGRLTSLRSEFEEVLGLKVDAEASLIEIYILDDRRAFEHFLKFYYPELPQRRAFFIAQGTRRVVYTFRSDRLDDDLRHEATHALLHVAVGNVPLWLDEGLAEYFEVGEVQGRNPEHLSRLKDELRDGWKPSLERLEAIGTVREMSPHDYREAWGWVHYLLNGPAAGRTALLEYLGELRGNDKIPPLSRRIGLNPGLGEQGLREHLARQEPSAPTAPAAARPSIRLQDGADDPEPSLPAARRRTLLGRIFGRVAPSGR